MVIGGMVAYFYDYFVFILHVPLIFFPFFSKLILRICHSHSSLLFFAVASVQDVVNQETLLSALKVIFPNEHILLQQRARSERNKGIVDEIDTINRLKLTFVRTRL